MARDPIRKAIIVASKAGWQPSPGMALDALTMHLAMDQGFWRALGKTAKWGERCRACLRLCTDGKCGGGTQWCPDVQAEWLYQQHRFIDHLASGRAPESFFGRLL